MPISLSDQLEIILPTYNRREHLQRTLTQLTAPESPVRHCSLTVLDNACTDGSSDLIEEFAAKCPNIKHIRHEKNIGGNGNIARAFELARKPYVWVVCDDDSFRWEAWPEVEEALFSNEYDILLTRKDDLKGTSNLAKIVRQLTFLPAGIYRTANIVGRDDLAQLAILAQNGHLGRVTVSYMADRVGLGRAKWVCFGEILSVIGFTF